MKYEESKYGEINEVALYSDNDSATFQHLATSSE
jgi:hypothetical protein